MKKILFLLAATLFCFNSLSGASLKTGYGPLCVTEELHKQFMTAAARNDKIEMRYLTENDRGCFFLPAGLHVTILEESLWNARAKVRVFVGKEAVVMWAHYLSIKRVEDAPP